MYKTVNQLKQDINNGYDVYLKNYNYKAIKDIKNQYLIICLSNHYTIGLTCKNGKTLNGNLKDFFRG